MTATLPAYIPATGLSISAGPTITPNYIKSNGEIYFQITHAKRIPNGGILEITLPNIAPFTTSAYNFYSMTLYNASPSNLGLKNPLTVTRVSNVFSIQLSKDFVGNDGLIDILIKGPLQTSIAAATITVRSLYLG